MPPSGSRQRDSRGKRWTGDAVKEIQFMWWWLVGLWPGGSILFVPILCLREMLVERREGSVERPSSQQAEVDRASSRHLLASAIVASAPERSIHAEYGARGHSRMTGPTCRCLSSPRGW